MFSFLVATTESFPGKPETAIISFVSVFAGGIESARIA